MAGSEQETDPSALTGRSRRALSGLRVFFFLLKIYFLMEMSGEIFCSPLFPSSTFPSGLFNLKSDWNGSGVKRFQFLGV